ncbi:MAG: hypothetical protein A2Z20_08340 [Bdellovibrionales bacterium RBG_16_40_8]|nr:MAG: hypothetical protein A2Z20_08340 [Bdellovibrionales bacterium RBG_16_40_8]
MNISSLPHRAAHIWLASSGSTESLTLYALSKAAFLISAEAVNAHINATKKDIWLNVLPTFHVSGLSIYARAFLLNTRVVDRANDIWRAESFHKWVKDEKATLTSLVPTQVHDLVKLGTPAPKSLRAIFVGGAKLDDDLYLNARSLGFRLLPTYGMTECCSQIATATLESLNKDDIPSLKMLSHVDVKAMNGEYLAISSPALFTAQAKWQNDQVSVLWWPCEWYVTADLGEVQKLEGEKGKIIIPHGRDRDEVKISGELVNLTELRVQLAKIAGTQFALFAQPDARRGFEIIVAFTASACVQASEWINEFNRIVLPVAKIRAAYFVDELPVSELGKIRIGDLKSKIGL